MEMDETQEDIDLSDDEEHITAQQVLATLEKAWHNEKLAPNILPHQTDMLDLMLGQIAHMEENIKCLNKNDFRSITHRMELERIRFIIASYLRCRLKKIERFTQAILKEEENRSPDEKRLSEQETIFANDYFNSVEAHFNQIVLQHIPTYFNDDVKARMIRPNMNTHVFIKVNETMDAVVGNDDEEIDLLAGSQHIVPYQLVADILLKGSVDLL